MGLFDSMFGGGTKVELFLDNNTASPGSVVGGRIILHGGNKPMRLTELSVRILYVSTKSREGSALPEIDIRELSKQIVAAGSPLAPTSTQTFAFRLTIPSDVGPSAHNVSYQVSAVADIPGVKDPSDTLDLQIVNASADSNRRLPLAEVLSRFQGLQSRDEEALCDALYDLFIACYSEGGSLMEVEPLIVSHIQHGTVSVRRKAIEAWANLVDNRVTPQHLQTLYALANMPGLDAETFEQVIVASTKFAEEGSLSLVQQLALHSSATVREQVASNLRFNSADKFSGKRELLVALAQDTSPEVRRAAIGGLSSFNDDQQIVYWIANLTDSDPSADVVSECIASLSLIHYHGMGDIALSVYEKQAANADSSVRAAVARQLSSQPQQALQRVWGIAQRLAADPDEEVRRALAFTFNNMSTMPQMLPLAQHMAQSDRSPEVRKAALEGMGALMQPTQAASYYGHAMTQARSEDEMWPVLNGLRHHRENRDVKQLLTQLGQCPFPDVANAARDALSY